MMTAATARAATSNLVGLNLRTAGALIRKDANILLSTYSVVGPEWRGREPRAVVKVRRRVVGPGVTDSRRERNRVAPDDNLIAFDLRVRPHELSVRTRHCEPVDLLAVRSAQSFSMRKPD